MRRLSAVVCSLLGPLACAAPPPAPGPRVHFLGKVEPPPGAAPPSAASFTPAPPPPEPPVVEGEPRPVPQRGLHSFASVVSISRSGALAAVVDQGTDIRLFDPRTAQERGLLRGHDGRVNDVDIAPTGDRLVSAGNDKTARLWDLTRGAEIATFSTDLLVYSATFSPDGKHIATTHPSAVQLWDASGRKLASLAARAADLAFSQDGRLLATWERDLHSSKDITLWELPSGAMKLRLAGGEGAHRKAAFSPDGSLIAWSKGERDVALSSSSNGQQLRLLPAAEQPSHLAFSADGARVAAGSDKVIQVWEVASGKPISSMRRTKGRGAFSFSPDGRLIAAPEEGDLALFEVATGRRRGALRGGDEWVTGFSFTPDGERIVGGSGIRSPQLIVWSINTGDRKIAARHGHFERQARWSDDGRLLVSLGAEGGTPASRWERSVRVWDAETGAIKAILQRPEGAPALRSDYHRVAASSDGSRVAASNLETTSLWDTATKTFIADLDQDDKYHTEHGLAFHPREPIVATSGGKKGEVRLWNAKTGKPLRSFSSGFPLAWALAFRPDGAELAVVGPREIAVFDPKSGRRLRSFAAPPGGGLDAVFSPDGKQLAVGSTTGVVWLVEAATGAKLKETEVPTLRTLSFSSDGGLLAAAGYNGPVRLWELPSFKPLPSLRDLDPEETGSVAFHPRTRALAVARGSLILFCEPSARTVTLQAVGAGAALSGFAVSSDGFFGGDAAALGELLFRKGDDLRAPMVPASGAASKQKTRLVGELIEGCKR